MNKKASILFVLGLFIGLILTSSGVYLIGNPFDNTDAISNDTATEEIVYETTQPESFEEPDYTQSLSGVATIHIQNESGKIISQGSAFRSTDNHFITNEHVLSMPDQDIDNIFVQYHNGEWSEAHIIGTDPQTDLAVVEPNTIPDSVQTLEFQSEKPKQGENITVIGTPNGRSQTITQGIISGIERSVQINNSNYTLPDTIQIDAALNQGNSGGPVVNTSTGNVIGVAQQTEGENLGFAISAQVTEKISSELIENGEYTHSYIGVFISEMNPTQEEYSEVQKGLKVESVDPNTPGEAFNSAEEGSPDIITHIDGKRITTLERFSTYLLLHTEPGDEVEMTVVQDGDTSTKTIQLTERS